MSIHTQAKGRTIDRIGLWTFIAGATLVVAGARMQRNAEGLV